jgi:DNA repair photolyase
MIYEPKGKAAEYARLAINHYTGCSHGCDYCYMKRMFEQKKVSPPFDAPRVKDKCLPLLAASCKKYAGTDKRVQVCFSTDPYQPLDDTVKLTRAVLAMLHDYKIPFQVLTKGGLSAVRDFDLYGTDDLFGVTLVSTDPDWLAGMEPAAAPFEERVGSLIRARAKGIKTWVSLEPVIDAAEALKVIRWTHAVVDLYKIGQLNYGITAVDWKDFARRAVDECHKVGALYYLKESLATLLEPQEYANTDWRMI